MKEELQTTIASACKELFDMEADIVLARPDEQFGDYATNVALHLSKQLGKKPHEIASILAHKLKETLSEKVTDVTIAGPGFLNIKLSDSALAELAEQAPTQSLVGKTVVAEYSDPNPFKVLHAGHLYTTVTGDAIAKLLENAGATVHRLNYGGDVGLHVGKTMWAIIEYLGGIHPESLGNVNTEERLEWLSERYVEGNSAYEDNPEAKQMIIELNQRVYDLVLNKEAHNDPDFSKIYWTCRQWSYDGFDRFYEQLQVSKFEKYVPESTVTAFGIEMVQRGIAEGVLVKSDGAVVFKGEPHGLHTRVFLNSAGLPTYEAKDLGLAASKWQEYNFDLSVIITANDITEYMKVVMKVLERFYPEGVERTKHFTHGMIKLPGSVKMSSRKGNILRATDILEAAREANKTLSGQTDNEDAILAAVKYAFLKNRIGGDIVYDPADSVALEGNSGPYLQYAHARARSILVKASLEPVELNGLEADERSLLRKIGEYAEVTDKAVAELMPHYICTFLYELAQTFNRFYEHNRVIDDPRQAVRLRLVNAYADVLKNGLDLLNIPAPARM